MKRNAGELFRDWLMKRRVDEIEPVMLSGVTDCYQPAERDYRLTRECLAVAIEFIPVRRTHKGNWNLVRPVLEDVQDI